MSRRKEFEAKYPLGANHNVTTDEYISLLGFSIDDDGEILDDNGKGTGFWFEEIEYYDDLEDATPRYWKVYAQCVRVPYPVIEISRQKALDFIWNSILSCENLKQVNKCFDEYAEDDELLDNELDKVWNRYYEKAVNSFEEDEFFGCGDYEIVKSVEMPSRPNSCGFSATFLD